MGACPHNVFCSVIKFCWNCYDLQNVLMKVEPRPPCKQRFLHQLFHNRIIYKSQYRNKISINAWINSIFTSNNNTKLPPCLIPNPKESLFSFPLHQQFPTASYPSSSFERTFPNSAK